MSRFIFESASAVAVGTFNIHIFTPGWLAKHGIELREHSNMEFAQSRPGFRFRLAGETQLLIVEPHRIHITSNENGFDCGHVLGAILRKLPETPLVAVGFNWVFSATLDDDKTIPAIEGLPSQVEDTMVASRAASVSFPPNDGTERSIRLEQLGRLVKAMGNFETKAADGSILADTCDHFSRSVQELITTASNAWNIDIEAFVSLDTQSRQPLHETQE